jgi:glucose uptake protein GlcU
MNIFLLIIFLISAFCLAFFARNLISAVFSFVFCGLVLMLFLTNNVRNYDFLQEILLFLSVYMVFCVFLFSCQKDDNFAVKKTKNREKLLKNIIISGFVFLIIGVCVFYMANSVENALQLDFSLFGDDFFHRFSELILSVCFALSFLGIVNKGKIFKHR